MARYVTSVATPLSAAEAFAYMADVTHFVEWDPGVKRVLRVAGDGAGVGAAYDLTVQAGGTTMMRYEVKEYEPPRRILLVARTSFLTSVDEVRVEASCASLESHTVSQWRHRCLGRLRFRRPPGRPF
jgi:hypothetical protein